MVKLICFVLLFLVACSHAPTKETPRPVLRAINPSVLHMQHEREARAKYLKTLKTPKKAFNIYR